MVRRNAASATALLEPADPVAIANKVATLEAEKRLSLASADVRRWREIVELVAKGTEPDGEMLADIGSISRRLKLPADSLATSVKAFQEEQRFSEMFHTAQAEMRDTRNRRDQIFSEIKGLEAKLSDLRLELQKYHGNAASIPAIAGARNECRVRYPMLFEPVDVVASRIVASQNGGAMSVDTVPPHFHSSAKWGE